MRVFPSGRGVRRRERRRLRQFFAVMGIVAALFAALLIARVLVG